MTVEEFNKLPEGPPYYELVNGSLVEMPLPKFFHQAVVGNIVRILIRYLDAFPMGEVLFGPCGVFLTSLDVFLPDAFSYLTIDWNSSPTAVLTARQTSLWKFFHLQPLILIVE